jgi:hypothetical protein
MGGQWTPYAYYCILKGEAYLQPKHCSIFRTETLQLQSEDFSCKFFLQRRAISINEQFSSIFQLHPIAMSDYQWDPVGNHCRARDITRCLETSSGDLKKISVKR